MDKKKDEEVLFIEARDNKGIQKVVIDIKKRLLRRKITRIAVQIVASTAVVTAIVIPVVYVWQKKNPSIPDDSIPFYIELP